MIVRISRARVMRNAEAAAFDILRTAVAGTPQPDGLQAMFIGRRLHGDENELVALTVWRDLDAMSATLGADWDRPQFLPALQPYLEQPTVEHFDTFVDRYEDLRDLIP